VPTHLGEIFLDWKFMWSDRLLYNDIVEIRGRMRIIDYYQGYLALFFALLFFSGYIIAVEIGMASSNQDLPYQSPLFSYLDDREMAEVSSQSGETTLLLQNATLLQGSSPVDAGERLNELPANAVNSVKPVNDTEDFKLYDRALSSPSFTLDNVTFGHYREDVNGITMHYVMGGEGDAIVLLHGWPQTWYEWRDIMPVLANNYTVVVPDLRGLGDSSKPATGYDANTTASDIYQLVSGLGFNNVYLVGHDMGSQTAYSYAAAHPNNVSALVVMEYMFPGLYSNASFAEPWWFSFHRTLDLPEVLVAGNEREYLSWFYRQLAYNPYSIDEVAINEYVRAYSAPGGMRSGFEYFRASPTDAMLNNETSSRTLATPILAVSGAYSPFRTGDTVPNNSLESAKRLAGNVSVVIMPFSGHWIPEEQPELLAGLILEFFNEKIQNQSSNVTGSKTANAIDNLLRSVDNESLLQPHISQTNNFTADLYPPSPSNTSTLSTQGQVGGEISNTSNSRNLSAARTNLTMEGQQGIELLTNQVSIPENGSSLGSARNVGGQTLQGDMVGEDSVADQGSPLSEAIEAISKLFGRNN
jgi:pimeloyl-ACP methyl ester carboxylesterase